MNETMSGNMKALFFGMFRKNICRLQIFKNGNISIGVGEKLAHCNVRLRDEYYGEWEIGSYHSNWIFFDQDRPLYSGGDAKSVLMSVEKNIGLIILGRQILDIQTIDNFKVKVIASSGSSFVFNSSDDMDDESFHIFSPNGFSLGFNSSKGWMLFDK